MPPCPSCKLEVLEAARFCPRCSAPLTQSSEVPTRAGPPPGPGGRGGSDPSGTVSGGRFLPGTMLADRYRIVGLLGKGGMGEVYRADDLKLGQAVALKFLPEALEKNQNRLERFLNEVRTARQVSHSNVCRVYDVGEVDGHHFLSMEYVDGEDLASLLRRIGHLPKEKAIELARQLAAGLATAHEAGVLHRDLKPANVMIDGRGRAKITDFGLASLVGQVQGEEIRSGTPAYMAPEQFDGREVTVQSDLYSLGLVLYELFTGKPPFEAASAAELRHKRTESTPTSPSSFVEGFDPSVERLILRCLDPDPARRPRSAMAIALALPGGDPLAAAVAAGETPSPEMVAEAGAAGGLHPGVASALLAGILVLSAAALFLGSPLQEIPLPKSAQVLEEKAREVLEQVGHDVPPLDSLSSFRSHSSYIREIQGREAGDALRSLAAPQPSPLRFYYRESPHALAGDYGSIGGWMIDPPNDRPGMAMVGLDTSGRLVALERVPPDREENPSPAGEPDWSVLFSAAGFDQSDFEPVTPEWAPPSHTDARAAWEGVYPEAPEIAIRLEAAAYHGKITYFRIIEPWTLPSSAPRRQTNLRKAVQWIPPVWFVTVLLGASFVAFRNVRLGRGDHKTALRLALYLGALRVLWFLGAHHLSSGDEVGLVRAHLAWSFYRAGLVYVFYLALEPYARRLWPRMLTSWVRLFDGRFRDPLVGRDLLIGGVIGSLWGGTSMLHHAIDTALGNAMGGLRIGVWFLESLRGLRQAVVSIIAIHTDSLFDLFMPIMMFLILRLLLRRTWVAVLVVTVFTALLFNPSPGAPTPSFLIAISINLALFWFTFLRLGLLPLVVAATWNELYSSLPLTHELSSWHGTATFLCLLVTLGVALYGFRIALAGRPLLADELSEARVPGG